jgi:hypothetical protein
VDIFKWTVSQYIQKILAMSFTNSQKRIRPSGFIGTVTLYHSNNSCRGDPAQSGGYDPQSNPAECINLPDGSAFANVDVNPTEPANYFIQFFTDTECTNQVSTYQGMDENCIYLLENDVVSLYLDY